MNWMLHWGRCCAVVGLGALSVAVWAQGNVEVDGSSTVEPITSAVAEEFGGNVSVGVSGTGGGFRRFCPGNGPGSGETDLSNASRPITGGEIARCITDEVDFVELPVAFDGLTVAVDRDQRIWPAGAPVCLTRGELARMWTLDSEGTIVRWRDVRPDLADAPITFTGAAETSGTRDAFLEFLDIDAQREDGFFTEDDQLLAQQVSQDPFGITYFGFAFFVNSVDLVRAVAIDPRDDLLSDSGQCRGELPEFDTIADSSYPFSRPLFIYVNAEGAQRAEVAGFVDFYMTVIDDEDLLADVGYIAMPGDTADAVRDRWNARRLGSTFSCNRGTVDELIGLTEPCPGRR